MLEYEADESNGKQKLSENKLEKRIADMDLSFDKLETRSNDGIYVNTWDKIKCFFVSIKNIFIYEEKIEEPGDKNKKTDSIGGLRFHINSRDAKPVEILLQRMFSNELNISNEDLSKT